MAKKDAPRLYLIDGSAYIFRAYHALPPLTRASDGLSVGAVAGFCNMLWKFLEEMKGAEAPTHLAVIFDKSEVTFRNKLYPEYKAHRPPAPEDLVPQFPMIRDATRAFNLPCIEMGGFEADDLIATYARQAAAGGASVRIVSSDKDLMQLIVEGVIQLYDPMKNRILGLDAVMEKFGVGPEKVIDAQALIGDSTDNVPGAPGIGPKTAAELINTFGSLDAILERANEIKQQKRRETLINFADQIRLSRELVTLKDDVDVEEKWESFALREPDPAMLLQFIDAMEFRTLGRRVREHFAKEKGVQIVASYTSAAPPLAPVHADDGAPRAGPVLEEIEREFKPDAYKIVRDLPALEDYIRRAKLAGAIGIDTEADSFDAMRAQLVGVSLSLAANDAIYIPLQHRGSESRAGELFAAEAPSETGALDTGTQIGLSAALAALQSLFEDASVTKVGLNIKWDIALFAKHKIALKAFDDPMLASYTLYGGLDDHDKTSLIEKHIGHGLTPYANVAGKGKAQQTFDLVPIEAAAAYSCEHADAALRLYRKLSPELASNHLITVYETLERPLPPVLAAMEREGIKVDPQMLSRLSGDFAQRMLQYESEAYGLAGKEFNLGSPKQLGEILFDELKLAGGGKTKTGAWSTDAAILEDLAEQHDLPAKVLEWRQLSKLRSTYTEALGAAINPQTNRVHTSYALASTTTGRLSSNDPNLQNIPIRTEEGRRIRDAFIAEKGNVLVSADYSQIELRLLAHVADIPQLKQAFADGVDIHARTASEMFGVPVEGMPKEIRSNAKAINFGIIYGISAFGLARNLGIAREEAAAYIKKYFERFPGIRDYMEETKAFARANGYVKTIFGRRIWVKGIQSKNPSERAFGERQSINAPLQGAAADIIRRAMVRLPAALAKAKLKSRMLLQVHDELVFEAPKEEADTLCKLAKDVMEAAPEPAAILSVPLTVEAKAGSSWGAAH
ncbi:DNA polymerase I [Candidatus Viadribacter manganicus]|uniref:DNA polymerase I n=1 Tax=Candidatus Viadribacter manganicus TaxID=1759059 RepID=A0A1B1AJA7_9PROT|nr:DNA polymerase I [Candidatus Viadribacter manganicus]ANP46631.1 DNA polymerase I [Candidatus Viadribacter manganicus]